MTDSQPQKRARSPLDHLSLPRPPQQAPALLIGHRRSLAFCQVMARARHAEAAAAALGLRADTRLATNGKEFTALPLAPGQWMLSAEWGRDGRFTADIMHRVRGLAYASAQSHGRAAFQVRGPTAIEILSRECRLDLATAPARFVGQTTMADVGVLIHKVDNAPTFDLTVYTGYAEHFWNWLNTTAQPFNPTFAEMVSPAE